MLRSFKTSQYLDQTIVDENGATVGTIRLKPSGVAWKPKHAKRYYSKSLDDFQDWITSPSTKAKRIKQ